jgi:hypothetical protein
MSQVTLTGSCLCGAVKYEISGETGAFYHCHCERCRKSSGTGHASNLRVMPETGLRWLTGEHLLKRYKVPEAERFYNNFCTACGSPMPRVMPSIGAVVIPAGTLDVEPPKTPDARIFWDSRAAWSCCGEPLPVHAEYPA